MQGLSSDPTLTIGLTTGMRGKALQSGNEVGRGGGVVLNSIENQLGFLQLDSPPHSALSSYGKLIFHFLLKMEEPMIKILVLRNSAVFKGLFINLIGCGQDKHLQSSWSSFSTVFKIVGHWSSLKKTPIILSLSQLW